MSIETVSSPMTAEEMFVIAVNKVSTVLYIGSVMVFGHLWGHDWATFVAIATAGILSLSEILFLASRQSHPELMPLATGLAMLSWVLGAASGVLLL